MDLVSGLAVYIATALVFGRQFELVPMLWAVLFAFGPDVDVIPYALLRRRLYLVSHWLIHFPSLYVPIGALVVWYAAGEWFYVTLFVLGSLAHFVHDSMSTPGIQWFWPLSSEAYALDNYWKFVRVDPSECRYFYDRLRERASERSLFEDLRMRVGRWRPKWFDRRRR